MLLVTVGASSRVLRIGWRLLKATMLHTIGLEAVLIEGRTAVEWPLRAADVPLTRTRRDSVAPNHLCWPVVLRWPVLHGSGVFDRPTSTWLSDSERPRPKSFRVARRRGLTGGKGDGLFMPFLRDAPGGKSTVSTLEVEESSAIGSEISDLEIVFLRSGPRERSVGPGGISGGVNFEPTGVFAPERGGVAM